MILFKIQSKLNMLSMGERVANARKEAIANERHELAKEALHSIKKELDQAQENVELVEKERLDSQHWYEFEFNALLHMILTSNGINTF